MIEVISNVAPEAQGPYSQAIISNNLVFFSGALPLKDGVLVTDYKEAIGVIMKNVESILLSAESSLEKLVKVTIFIKDINMFSVVNEEYEKYLSHPFPARSVVEVSNIPKGAILEIEGVAEL